jgi:ABC-type spermidine/putrescine transport system permease subunit I
VRGSVTGLRSRIRPGIPPLALWPVLVYLAIFYVVPVVRVLTRSLFDPGFTLGHYRRLALAPMYGAVMGNTFEIAITVAIVCVVLGYPTAYMLATARPRVATALLACVMVPFFTSALVRNYAWIFLLGSRGVVNGMLMRLGLISTPLPLMFNRVGVVIGMVNVLLPYTILMLLSVMRGIRRDLVTAAQSLMASPFTAFRRVFVPLTMPGVAASFLLVFVLALGFFITPAMLGGPHEVMIANVISSVTGSLNWGLAGALATVLLGASALVIMATLYLSGGVGLFEDPGRVGWRGSRGRPSREGGMTRVIDSVFTPIWPRIFTVIGGGMLVFLVVPVILMIPLSFSSGAFFVFPPPGFSLQWYVKYFTAAGWLDSTWHSILIAVITAGLSLLLATPAAVAMSRWSSRMSRVVYLAVLSPIIMPSIIVAVGAFFLLSSMRLTHTAIGVVLGHTVIATPVAIIVLAAALRNFDRNIERAAISLGSSPIRTMLRVTLPVLSTAVWTAALLTFLQSFDELLIALFVSGIDARTLPKKMWESLQELDPTIAAASTLLVALAVGVLLTVAMVQRAGERRVAQRRGVGELVMPEGPSRG